MLFRSQLGGAPGADLAALDARVDAVRAYFRFVDGLIGEAGRDLGPGDVLAAPAAPPLVQGPATGRGTLTGFRYRVTLKAVPTDPDSPALESPVFDDITFNAQAATGPRVLTWEMP